MATIETKERLNKEVVGTEFKRPENWEEFRDVLERAPNMGRIPRSDYTESVFGFYRKVLQMYGYEMSDVIEKKIGNRDIVLLPNQFAYDWLYEKLDENLAKEGKRVGHFCLWSRNGEMYEDEISLAMDRLMPDVRNWVSFVNPRRFQSIKEIWHAHIFAEIDVEDGRIDTSPHRLDFRWMQWVGKSLEK